MISAGIIQCEDIKRPRVHMLEWQNTSVSAIIFLPLFQILFKNFILNIG